MTEDHVLTRDSAAGTPDDSLAKQKQEEAARLEAGRHLFAQTCTFILSSTKMSNLPDMDHPESLDEVAFAGRSNVGKSTLINALTNQKGLARASNTPGRTQQINFFDLGGRLMLVDLPGYGYAKAPKADVKRWSLLVNDYLRGRPNLRRVCLLIDSRHGLKPTDLEAMALMDKAAVNYQIILTKSDKPKRSDLDTVVRKTTEAVSKRPAAHPVVCLTSSETGDGIAALRAELALLARSRV